MSEDCTDLEFHLPGHRFTGPGTDLNKRLEADGITPKVKYKPINRIDGLSLKHDIYYREHPTARERTEGDKIMIDELGNIPNPTCREYIERCIVVPLLFIKRSIVLAWLSIIDKLRGH